MAVNNLSNANSDGSLLGQSALDKFAFHGATPAIQASAIADATDAATVITRCNLILAALRTKGLIAT